MSTNEIGVITQVKHHEHDCSHCTYLGSTVMVSPFLCVPEKPMPVDMYHCYQGEGEALPTTLVRYGVEEKYLSGATFGIHALKEGDLKHPQAMAVMLAVARGLKVK